MQTPSRDIYSVLDLVFSPASPNIQKAAMDKYFTSDAGYRNPGYAIKPGRESRESVLAIYQWYQTVWARIEVDVQDVSYDRLHDTLFVDLIQRFHPRFTLFGPTSVRSLCRFTLRLDRPRGLHFIAMQEDFLHPDDYTAYTCPPLSPLVSLWILISTLKSQLLHKCAQTLGIWRADPDSIYHVPHEEICAREVDERQGEKRLRRLMRREGNRAVVRAMRKKTREEQEKDEEDGDDIENGDVTVTPETACGKEVEDLGNIHKNIFGGVAEVGCAGPKSLN